MQKSLKQYAQSHPTNTSLNPCWVSLSADTLLPFVEQLYPEMDSNQAYTYAFLELDNELQKTLNNNYVLIDTVFVADGVKTHLLVQKHILLEYLTQ